MKVIFEFVRGVMRLIFNYVVLLIFMLGLLELSLEYLGFK